MLRLHPIAAFTDNYIWALHDGQSALVVDPGDAQVVLDWLDREGLTLTGLLLTHHHADHTGGVDALQAQWSCKAWGPAYETLPGQVHRVDDGDTLTWQGVTIRVWSVPGHTAGHVAYLVDWPEAPAVLFCGDTLFSAGCGRLFEGSPAQMLNSLDRLSTLPPDTRVCCAHEYTLSNLRFARHVEPDHLGLAHYETQCMAARARHQPTLPSTIGLERRINPFLRSREPSIRRALSLQGIECASDVDAFGALRAWKDRFR